VEEGGLLVTNLLLSHRANVDLQDADGSTPFMLMVRRATFNVLQLFLNHHQWVATPQRQDFSGAVLLLAVNFQLESVVSFVVDYDCASLATRNARGETPLHRAILQRDPSMMELLSGLASEGDALTAVTIDQETPAHYAALHGTCPVVETLLRCLMRSC
jgi:ankyrin repeat protein